MGDTHQVEGLRARKKERTRRALIDAAYLLFDRKGYESTTIVEIADAADVSVGTFFNHFPVKEDVLFPDNDVILAAARRAIAGREPGQQPAEALGGAIKQALDHGAGQDLDDAAQVARIRMIMARPTLQAAVSQRLLHAQQHLIETLREAYPELSDAALLVGAMVGGVVAAVQESVLRGSPLAEVLAAGQRAVEVLTQAMRGIS
jgi:AcrR family transcriptional regulator